MAAVTLAHDELTASESTTMAVCIAFANQKSASVCRYFAGILFSAHGGGPLEWHAMPPDGEQR
jgi:hypothetical protein